jgi:deoxyribonuclease-2
VSETLDQVYSDKKTDVGYVIYNDEDPDGKSHTSRAHSKGIMALDAKQGFWVIHSVPSFPVAVDDTYEPCCTNGLKYGQHFMCMTLDTDQFDYLGKLGQINWPSQIDSFIPDSLREKYSDFADFVDDQEDKDTLSTSMQIETVGGQRFTVFAKNAHWGKDLYEDLVAPKLDVDLQASTWQNGVGAEDSYCAGKKYDYTVVNVATQERAGTTWKESQDHSKWAISYFPSDNEGLLLTNRTSRQLRGTATKKYICVGDINRMTSQEHRGGGTACTYSSGMWSEFNKGIATVEDC